MATDLLMSVWVETQLLPERAKPYEKIRSRNRNPMIDRTYRVAGETVHGVSCGIE